MINEYYMSSLRNKFSCTVYLFIKMHVSSHQDIDTLHSEEVACRQEVLKDWNGTMMMICVCVE